MNIIKHIHYGILYYFLLVPTTIVYKFLKLKIYKPQRNELRQKTAQVNTISKQRNRQAPFPWFVKLTQTLLPSRYAYKNKNGNEVKLPDEIYTLF